MFYLASHFGPKRKFTFLAILFSLALGMGCFQNYYRARQAEMEEFQRMVAVGELEKYYIVHIGGYSLHLDSIRLEEMRIRGKVEPMPRDRLRYTEPNKPNRYKSKDKKVLQEVHLYLTPGDGYLSFDESRLDAPITSINEIQIYDLDVGSTTTSHVISTVGIVGGVIVIAAIANESSKPAPPPTSSSSCPYIYAYDGQTFRLMGEAFGGAILPSLERHDFMPLPGIKPLNGQYHIRIANELQEKERINLAYLDVVNHPADVEVLMSQKGTVHTIRHPQPAAIAMTDAQQNVLQDLEKTDNRYYYFYGGGANRSEVVLEFEKPSNAQTGKLILRANSSYWADFMFGEYTRQFGIFYDSWVNRVKEFPPEQVHNWLSSQAIPLSVYLETRHGWQLVEEVNPIGPLAARDFVVPIDLANHKGQRLRVKLSTGNLFWQADYAAMDFTADLPVKTTQVIPSFAMGSDGKVYTDVLARNDSLYLRQDYTGHQAEVIYPVPEAEKGEKQTIFLHTKGYYEPLREYEGYPDVFELHRFSKPEYLLEFSRERLQWFLEANGMDGDLFLSSNPQ